MTPRRRAAGFLALPLLLLAGCSGGKVDGAATPSTTAVTPRPPAPKPSDYPTGTSDPAETTQPADDGVYRFGEVAAWEDGVQATVMSAKRVSSFGEYADLKGPGIKVKVRIKAGSAPLDLALTVDTRLGADGENAEQSYAEGCDALSDLGRLAAGRTATGTFCFAGKATTVDVSVAPTYDHNALTWTGKVT